MTFMMVVNLIRNFPMGGTTEGRYYNGLIHGGAVVFVLWLAGVASF